MRSKVMAAFLALVMVVACFGGCALFGDTGDKPVEPDTPSAGEVDYEKVYSEVLQSYYKAIAKPVALGDVEDRYLGVTEAAQVFGAHALDEIGYLFMDLNADGKKELLIGISMDEDFAYTKNTLYAVYTLKNDAPVFVVEGRSRSSYALMKNGNFFYIGSNGAMYTIFGEEMLDKSGELKTKDFYFSYEKDASFTEVGFYHNTTGVYEKTQAEELKISEEEFAKLQEALADNTDVLAFKPFSEMEGAEDIVDPEQGMLPAAFCGSWTCVVKAGGGESFALFVDLNADGTATYRCGPPESEIMVDYRGTWEVDDSELELEMVDRYDGYDFDGEYAWSVEGGQLILQHKDGDSFLYGTEGQRFTFTAK